MKYLLLALILTGCGLIDDIEEIVDPPPKVIEVDHQFIPCAQDSAQAADTVNFIRCDVSPPNPTSEGNP